MLHTFHSAFPGSLYKESCSSLFPRLSLQTELSQALPTNRAFPDSPYKQSCSSPFPGSILRAWEWARAAQLWDQRVWWLDYWPLSHWDVIRWHTLHVAELCNMMRAKYTGHNVLKLLQTPHLMLGMRGFGYFDNDVLFEYFRFLGLIHGSKGA